MSNYCKRLTITITGESTDGLCYSLGEVWRKVGEGYLSGSDENETDNYEFDITEDLNEPLAPAQAGDDA